MKEAIRLQRTDNLAAASEALAYLDQGREFYNSALSSSSNASRPLQLYYAYMNIAKSFVISRGNYDSLPELFHGIIEDAGTKNDGLDALLTLKPNVAGNPKLNVFDLFSQALGYPPLTAKRNVKISHVIPQILPGHRLWSAGAGKKERFIAIEEIRFLHGSRTKKVWTQYEIDRGDLKRLGLTQSDLLVRSGLGDRFEIVKSGVRPNTKPIIFQQKDTNTNKRPTDELPALVDEIREMLWSTVGSSPPYRRYYLYAAPPSEALDRMPQLLSIYALTFYLGSLTRYRPNKYAALLSGPMAGRISDFIQGQPAQFVYLTASEFLRRDVTRPSIV